MIGSLKANPDLVALNPELLGEADVSLRDELTVPNANSLRPARFKSKTEQQSLDFLLHHAGPDAVILYEPIVLRLTGGNYTPDWVVNFGSTPGRTSDLVVMYEVKGTGGFRAYQSGRSSRIQLKNAARLVYQMFGWRTVLLQRTQQGWEPEVMEP